MKTAHQRRVWVREHNRKMYRLRHGIPLDAPLSKRGNKRGARVKTERKAGKRKWKYYWEKPGFVPPVFTI